MIVPPGAVEWRTHYLNELHLLWYFGRRYSVTLTWWWNVFAPIPFATRGPQEWVVWWWNISLVVGGLEYRP